MGAMMLHPESREEVRQLLSQPPELNNLLDDMDIGAKRIALRDCALLASVDGDYDESELTALKAIADSAGLSEKDLSNVLEWVSKSWIHTAKGRSLISLSIPGDENIR